MRTCEKCGERKKLTAFAKDSKRASGRSHVCRACKQNKPVQYDAMAELETREEA